MTARILKIALGLLLAVVLFGAAWLGTAGRPLMLLATGSVSHGLCDAAFVSHVDPERVFREQHAPQMHGIAWAIRWHVDPVQHEAHASLLGAFGAYAVFRPGLGCLLMLGLGLQIANRSEQQHWFGPSYVSALPPPQVRVVAAKPVSALIDELRPLQDQLARMAKKDGDGADSTAEED